jgi:hypothetical protein
VTFAKIFWAALVHVVRDPAYEFGDDVKFADNVRCAARTETDE